MTDVKAEALAVSAQLADMENLIGKINQMVTRAVTSNDPDLARGALRLTYKLDAKQNELLQQVRDFRDRACGP